jgi:hypothetical protein
METKSCHYDLSREAYELIGRASKELGVKKSAFVDILIKKYANELIEDVAQKLKRYEES